MPEVMPAQARHQLALDEPVPVRQMVILTSGKSGLWSGRLTVLQNLTEARSCCIGSFSGIR